MQLHAERLQSECAGAREEIEALKLRITELERQLREGNESAAAESEVRLVLCTCHGNRLQH